MNTPADAGFPLYHRVAGELAQAIQLGSLRTGDRLPSVRQLCQQHGVSASTVTLAYRWPVGASNPSLVTLITCDPGDAFARADTMWSYTP